MTRASKAADICTREEYEHFYTGLRVNEVRQLIWADINIKERFVRVRPTTTKNSKASTLPLHSYLIELLKDWKDKHPEEMYRSFIIYGIKKG